MRPTLLVSLAALAFAACAASSQARDPGPADRETARTAWLAEFKAFLEAIDLTSLEAIDAALKRIEKEKRPDQKRPDDPAGWLGSNLDAQVKRRMLELVRAKDSLLRAASARSRAEVK